MVVGQPRVSWTIWLVLLCGVLSFVAPIGGGQPGPAARGGLDGAQPAYAGRSCRRAGDEVGLVDQRCCRSPAPTAVPASRRRGPAHCGARSSRPVARTCRRPGRVRPVDRSTLPLRLLMHCSLSPFCVSPIPMNRCGRRGPRLSGAVRAAVRGAVARRPPTPGRLPPKPGRGGLTRPVDATRRATWPGTTARSWSPRTRSSWARCCPSTRLTAPCCALSATGPP